MKITKIRNKDGSKLNDQQMRDLIQTLETSIMRAGFITEVSQVNSTSVKVGMHMCSFRINVGKLGYNARINHITVVSCKVGFKKTSTPTWTQREEFNHLINNALDSQKLTANIRSGEYVVRSSESGRVNSWDMPQPFHNGYRLQVDSVLEIVPMKYAQDGVEWVGVNAPFIGAVPEMKPRFAPRKAHLKLVA